MGSKLSLLHGQVVEDEVQMTLAQLCQACGTSHELVEELVAHGVLEPRGDAPQRWLFVGTSLSRTRVALRLLHDLELNLPGAALAVDLLEELDRLRHELHVTQGLPLDP